MKTSANAPVAEPTPDFSSDQFLIGQWSCDLQREGRQPAKEEAFYSWALGGQWLALTYTLTPGEADLPVTTTMAYETFDAALRKWVYFSFRSDGVYGTSYSDGWCRNVKIYEPAVDAPQKFRLVVTKVSDQEFSEEVEIPSGNGWRRTFLLRCRKAATSTT